MYVPVKICTSLEVQLNKVLLEYSLIKQSTNPVANSQESHFNRIIRTYVCGFYIHR